VRVWTAFVLRFRWAVLTAWAVVAIAGFVAFQHLAPLLSNQFTVPGTDSERVRVVLQERFGDRADGSFQVVFRVPSTADPALLRRLNVVVARAAAQVRTGRPTPLLVASRHVAYANIVTALDFSSAKGFTPRLVRAVGQPPGVERAYVTGAPAIQHDLDPIFKHDLLKGEAIALPIALLVLVGVFGISGAIAIPFAFAAATIFGALGILYGVAQLATTPTYATNLVQLIGLGIAVDYSLLVVYRFREELAEGKDADEAVLRTMETAGRAVVFSGATVAIGLALLIALPLPFMRMLGIAGFLIPVVSLLAALTLQPALLSIFGRRGVARVRVLPRRRRRSRRLRSLPGSVEPTPGDLEMGFWARLARSIMKRPVAYLAAGATVLVVAALPAFWIALTPGSSFGIPRFPQSIRGFDVLRAATGPGGVGSAQVLVDTGAGGDARAPQVRAAVGRLLVELRRDPEVARAYWQPGGRFVDPSGRYTQLIALSRDDYGEPRAQAFARRLRSELIPAARFPAGTRVLAGGGPPQGVDFLDQAYRYFPYLVGGVLVLTYFLLMRAFRSVLLPLKAVLLNLLSVGASYGVLVVVFRWGLGQALLGTYQDAQVEGWIPIFLFAMLFGLSMDYEVFLVTRMRETWDAGADNATAVAHGLERTGRIVTAAAIIMCAAFSGFVAGRIVGLQQFGVGLAVAIFVDATLVRSLLVPSLMALFGRWNWWLPRRLERALRVRPLRSR
jgi:trehalose monomycolate/heme transporter